MLEFSGNPPKLCGNCFSKKFPHQEIRWNYGILRSDQLSQASKKIFHRFFKKNLSQKTMQFFFLSGFPFTDTDDLHDGRGREGTIFYSTLPLPPAHEHSLIYLQLCMWDDCHTFLIALLVFTRLVLDEIYNLIELPFDWFTA